MFAGGLSVLTAYSFAIVHRKGANCCNADALSCNLLCCKCASCSDCKFTVCEARCTGKRHKKPCNTHGAEVGLSHGGPKNIEDTPAEQSENEWFSNWIGKLGQAKLKKLQHKDVTIKKFLDLNQKGGDTPRCVNIAMKGSGLKAMWVYTAVCPSTLWGSLLP